MWGSASLYRRSAVVTEGMLRLHFGLAGWTRALFWLWCRADIHQDGAYSADSERLYTGRWGWCDVAATLRIGLKPWWGWCVDGGWQFVAASHRWGCIRTGRHGWRVYPGSLNLAGWSRWLVRLQESQLVLCVVDLLLEAYQFLTEGEKFTLRELSVDEEFHGPVDQVVALCVHLTGQVVNGGP